MAKKEWETCKDETVVVRVLKKDWETVRERSKEWNVTLMTTFHKMLEGLKK